MMYEYNVIIQVHMMKTNECGLSHENCVCIQKPKIPQLIIFL